jgi:hypothetical protein
MPPKASSCRTTSHTRGQQLDTLQVTERLHGNTVSWRDRPGLRGLADLLMSGRVVVAAQVRRVAI